MTKSKLLIAAISLVLAAGAATAASAETPWEHNHPRRDQVNDRLERQNHRIKVERAEGELNGRQALRLHRADHRIRVQERSYAAWHGGHISKAEQHRLNREENRASRHIGV